MVRNIIIRAASAPVKDVYVTANLFFFFFFSYAPSAKIMILFDRYSFICSYLWDKNILVLNTNFGSENKAG